ncbi:hypothetical protein BDZ91DRAFT_722590 [Kalaharituber pfeilii]|nr:hypothetical protein BDZ91DRAFT_722590 [Kalaharituber pfeilii]
MVLQPGNLSSSQEVGTRVQVHTCTRTLAPSYKYPVSSATTCLSSIGQGCTGWLKGSVDKDVAFSYLLIYFINISWACWIHTM